MRRIFVDNLPKFNSNINRIDWIKSIGHSVDFIYDDIIGNIDIINYKDNYLYIKYLDYPIFKIDYDSFKKCKIGKLLCKYTNQFKINIDTHFIDNKRDLLIINREKRGRFKYYQYVCNKCNYIHWIEESNLIKGIGCACCAGKVVVKGVNDIATTHPYLCKYFVNINDTYINSYSSSKNIQFKCPYCGEIKTSNTNKLYTYGFSCNKCSDGISYPEKFVNEFLSQLNIKYIYQLSKKNNSWCDKYKYDFAILDKSCIIEVNGLNHYTKNNFSSLGGKTLLEEQENDMIKENLAKQNSIKNYIIIDARYSELEWIKNSIINSNLQILINFKKEDIDWLKCHEFALSNLVKEACNYKKDNDNLSTSDISKIMKLATSTILRYLKQGAKLNWCNYDVVTERNKGLELGRMGHKRNKLV